MDYGSNNITTFKTVFQGKRIRLKTKKTTQYLLWELINIKQNNKQFQIRFTTKRIPYYFDKKHTLFVNRDNNVWRIEFPKNGQIVL